jgi:hypothetical protein
MKPREGVEVPKESPTAAEVSGVEVQPEVPEEAVLEGVDGNSEGGTLRLEGVQILDSQPQKEGESAENPENGVIVAQSEGFEPVPAVSQEAFDTLEAIMKESKAATGATKNEPEVIPPWHGKMMDEALAALKDPIRTVLATTTMEGVVTEEVQMGELPNGEYRATVRLAEGFVEGAKQQAEADGISLEDWLTLQLNAYLEQWWMAPGPR